MTGAVVMGIVIVAATLYWLLVTSEGVYLGSKAVIALYDRSAEVYDRIKGVMPHEDARHLALPMLDALQGVTAPLILDVATGTARLPLAMLRQLEFAGKVVGLDLSARMLAVARRRTRQHPDQVALVRQDASKLPFASGSFDAVTSLEAFEFLSDQRAALAEMIRVLRPGGTFMLTNRIGTDALFLPGRSFRPTQLEESLRRSGLVNVETRRWQVDYDLLQGAKPHS